jgi:hypothetical protein
MEADQPAAAAGAASVSSRSGASPSCSASCTSSPSGSACTASAAAAAAVERVLRRLPPALMAQQTVWADLAGTQASWLIPADSQPWRGRRCAGHMPGSCEGHNTFLPARSGSMIHLMSVACMHRRLPYLKLLQGVLPPPAPPAAPSAAPPAAPAPPACHPSCQQPGACRLQRQPWRRPWLRPRGLRPVQGFELTSVGRKASKLAETSRYQARPGKRCAGHKPGPLVRATAHSALQHSQAARFASSCMHAQEAALPAPAAAAAVAAAGCCSCPACLAWPAPLAAAWPLRPRALAAAGAAVRGWHVSVGCLSKQLSWQRPASQGSLVLCGPQASALVRATTHSAPQHTQASRFISRCRHAQEAALPAAAAAAAAAAVAAACCSSSCPSRLDRLCCLACSCLAWPVPLAAALPCLPVATPGLRLRALAAAGAAVGGRHRSVGCLSKQLSWAAETSRQPARDRRPLCGPQAGALVWRTAAADLHHTVMQ